MINGTDHREPAQELLEEPLKEVYLIVRPEEKYDLEAALQTVMAPIYSTIHGLGRGGRGGLSYAAPPKRGPLRWFRKPELSVLLPKTIFYFVIPESRVQPVIDAAGAVLRAKGGPGDCGLGVAIVSDIEADAVIGPKPREAYAAAPAPIGSHSADPAAPEGNSAIRASREAYSAAAAGGFDEGPP
jgi:nitrogen regulatory protein PII